MIKSLKILHRQGKQFIPDLVKAEVPGVFKGRPIISLARVDEEALCQICPTKAIMPSPIRIDLGRCVFCGECSIHFPEKIQFTKDYKIATNKREALVIVEGKESSIDFDQYTIRKEIRKLFKHSLKLRQVSAGGDNSAEMELNAANNVNFDMSRFGIEFVASPRHADGLVITGPISQNMSKALHLCYEAMPEPKIIILAGTDAISGGIFEDSPAIDRSFLSQYPVDLFVPGNPPHPLTFINGILKLVGRI